jgi:hypothetical protein
MATWKRGEQMLIVAAVKENRGLKFSLLLIMACLISVPAWGGPYRDSAHGNDTYGVSRSVLSGKYAIGNCAHCHEMHASIEGGEPAPQSGVPSAHVLFADNFDSSVTENPYLEEHNFCFYCHSDNSGQQVLNRDYSVTFGGDSIATGPQSIMTAFNQASYHNLNDINSFLATEPTYSSWYAKLSNPCSACHDPHLAKRNWGNLLPGSPPPSAISKPGLGSSGVRTLWGEVFAEVMTAYSSALYEAPYSSGTAREPAGVGDANGANTPDYVGFCSSCHNEVINITSTTLGRDLNRINWTDTGLEQDKHGALARDGTYDGADRLRDPYAFSATTYSNFILSCLDCHEAHGSENIALLRRRINGENLDGVVTDVSTETMGYVCMRCHTDDQTAGVIGAIQPNTWEHVHHLTLDAPYSQGTCNNCHDSGSNHIDCRTCHFHGGTDVGDGTGDGTPGSGIKTQSLATGRRTF